MQENTCFSYRVSFAHSGWNDCNFPKFSGSSRPTHAVPVHHGERRLSSGPVIEQCGNGSAASRRKLQFADARGAFNRMTLKPQNESELGRRASATALGDAAIKRPLISLNFNN
jgi:hypothetical protein